MARRAVAAAVLLVMVAAPVGARMELADARRDLARTRAVARAADDDVRSRRSEVSEAEVALGTAETDEAAAATEVERARTQLAATGVEERDLIRVRDETRGRLDAVEAQRTMADALLHQQELDLPAAAECVLEGHRGLNRSKPAPPCPVAPSAPTGVK